MDSNQLIKLILFKILIFVFFHYCPVYIQKFNGILSIYNFESVLRMRLIQICEVVARVKDRQKSKLKLHEKMPWLSQICWRVTTIYRTKFICCFHPTCEVQLLMNYESSVTPQTPCPGIFHPEPVI